MKMDKTKLIGDTVAQVLELEERVKATILIYIIDTKKNQDLRNMCSIYVMIVIKSPKKH